jgi:hypothetical protein
MSKRLQVVLPDPEMAEIQRLAERDRLTVGEWVRRALRDARASRPVHDSESKLKAVRRGAQYTFPAADVEQMLSEIEQGYLVEKIPRLGGAPSTPQQAP